jgi:hypothetical protein
MAAMCLNFFEGIHQPYKLEAAGSALAEQQNGCNEERA